MVDKCPECGAKVITTKIRRKNETVYHIEIFCTECKWGKRLEEINNGE